MRFFFIAAVLTIGSFSCEAEQVCPWMNSATAGGVLGGGLVTATVTHAVRNEKDGACEFNREGPVLDTLRVEVTTLLHSPGDLGPWLSQCGAKVLPLRGIGNEAFACDIKRQAQTSQSQTTVQVISRIRDRVLLVRIARNETSTTLQLLREQAHSIAEQVAGNLF